MKTDGLIIEAFRPLSQTPLQSLLRIFDYIENDSIFSQFQPFFLGYIFLFILGHFILQIEFSFSEWNAPYQSWESRRDLTIVIHDTDIALALIVGGLH